VLDGVRALFPMAATHGFMPEHRQFWELVEQVRIDNTPQNVAFVLFRDGGKSTTSRMANAKLIAQRRRRFCLVVGSTQKKANAQVGLIQRLFESPEMQLHYPDVGHPKMTLRNTQVAWRQTGVAMLQTANGGTVAGVGLETDFRGLLVDFGRPDLICPDDIDVLHESPEQVRKKLQALRSTVLGMRGPDTWIMFCQNLIHHYSIMTGVVRREIDFLRDCVVIGPVPIVRNCEIEEETQREDGRNVIVAGEAAWPERYPMEACQRILQDQGLETFRAEYLHDVDRLAAGAVYPTWSEPVHISTWDEVCDAIGPEEVINEAGEVTLGPDWGFLVGLDVGATMGHRMVATLWATPPARLDRFGIDDIFFKVGELCRPRTESDLPDMTAEIFGELLLDTWFSVGAEFRALRFPLAKLQGALMSHERKTERNVFREYLSRKIPFLAYTGGASGGLEQMRTAMRPDPTRVHPLNRYPAGYRDPKTGADLGGQPIAKRPGVIWLVASGHGEKELAEDGSLVVRKGRGDAGMERGRTEMPKYHYVREVASGIERFVPYNKELNDACDADRMVSYLAFGDQSRLPEHERMMRQLNEAVPLPDPEAPRTGLEPSLAEIHHTRIVEMNRMLREQKNSGAVGGPRRRRGGLS